MSWSISVSGCREKSIENVEALAPPTSPAGGLAEHFQFERARAFVLCELRASTKKFCSVSACGWLDANGHAQTTISKFALRDDQG